MHSYTARANAFVSHILILLLSVALLGSMIGYKQIYQNHPNISLTNVQVDLFRRSIRDDCEEAVIKFDLKGNLESLWNWNTNHIYIYIVAEYGTKRNKRNEVVIWDSVLSREKDTKFQIKNQWNKYSLKDIGYGLRGTDVVFKFKYNIMPHMGMLVFGQAGEAALTIPQYYSGKR